MTKLVKKLMIRRRQRRADREMVAGRPQRAAKSLACVIRRDPDAMQSQQYMAVIKVDMGEYEEAERLIRNISTDGDSCARFLPLGELYYQWGKRLEARQAYEKAMSECRGSPLSELARKRLEKCESPIKFGESNESVHLLTSGTRALAQGDWETARIALKAAIRFDGTNWLALVRLAYIAKRRDRDPMVALRCLRRASDMTSCALVVRALQHAWADAVVARARGTISQVPEIHAT